MQSQPMPQAYPQGAFAAPQSRGEVAGESRSIGFRGIAIEFPAIRFELPTIQLPSCIRFRKEPEMRIAESYAPYVPGHPAIYGQIAPGGAAQVAPQMHSAPMYQRVPAAECQSQPQASPYQSCETQTGQIHRQIEQTTESIQDLKSKLEQLQEIEQELQKLTDEQAKLLRDIQDKRCQPQTGKPPVDAPAPESSDRYYFPK